MWARWLGHVFFAGGSLALAPTLAVYLALTPLYVKTAAQEASLSCWRVRKSLMTR